MKNLRAAIASAFLLVCTPAFAQWQTPNHSVPVGRGPGVTGFGSVAPGTAGQPLVSQGAGADPAFGTITNAGIPAGPADTYKGSLNGTSTTDIPRAPCTGVNQALRYGAGVGESCGNISVQTGFDMPINLGLSVPAPSGGALVINLTQANGSAPTSSNPVLVPFRSTVLTTGTTVWSTITAAQSITIPSGATLGTSSNSGSCANGSTCPFRVWVFEGYNGGTPELGVATCSNPTTIFGCASWENTLVTSTTISAGATTAGKLYATTGANLDAVRIIGYCDFASGLAAAGTWSSACTTLQQFGPGIKKPGDIVQGPITGVSVTPQTSSGATPTPVQPQATVTPSAPMNLIRISADGSLLQGGASSAYPFARLYRAAGASPVCTTALGSIAVAGIGGSGTGLSTHNSALDSPGVVSQITYAACVWEVTTGNATWCAAFTGVASSCNISVDEIMGKLEREPANDNAKLAMVG